MWELIMSAATAPETTITIAKYQNEHQCRDEQRKLVSALLKALDAGIYEPDETGFAWGPGLNCKPIER